LTALCSTRDWISSFRACRIRNASRQASIPMICRLAVSSVS
jgi:hypothetical protein